MPKLLHPNFKSLITALLFLAIIQSTLNSCSKSSPSPNKPLVKTGTNVYVVGIYYTQNMTPVAAYWKDGVLHKLVTDTTIESFATGIAIKDTNVYICGAIKGTAVYWKNGALTTVATDAEAEAITVSGNDVYLAGINYINRNYVAAYWKNNTLFSIGDTTLMATPTSIAVNGSDVYVVAQEYDTKSSYNSLVLWKNGIKSSIYSNNSGSAINTLAINGSDVYITGDINYFSSNNGSQAILWKNGKLDFIYQPATASISGTNTITINNNIIYLAGYSNSKAVYWSSSDNFYTEHDLTSSSQYIATGITFNKTDMYIAGNEQTTLTSNAVYWKNGTMVKLTNNSYTSGIGVVQY